MINRVLKYRVLICLLLTLSCRSAEAKDAERIVSLGPINTENVYLLGAGDRLVGNTRYCVRPAAARLKEKIGSVMQVSVEKIISLQPDLVLATALTRPEQVRQLQRLGFKVVRFKQPASFAEICSQFVELGTLLGREEEALRIVNQAREEVKAVQRKIAHLPRQKVFLQVGSRSLFGSVSSSFTHDFIVLGGGINIIEDQKSGTTNREKIIGQNPEVIIIAIMGSETGIAAEEKKSWQRIGVIKAVQEKRVHVLDPDLVCSPSPVTFVQALRTIAALIHPEIAMEVNQ
ncbi:MAG: ABC transporter substrate-binding protein [Proteobacteria bacterium]|nr:ABC transporter substrate-binding protein [Pseudomonadota bacterium]MBU1640543.1 ABC transporter substrate-binding protein [Pseudomonadota bacterium]